MQILSRPRLQKLLGERRLTLSKMARECAISRQSLYKMLAGMPIYNTPFLKLIQFLRVEPEEVTEESSVETLFLRMAPLKIQKTALELIQFCKKHQATLLLFGSQARGTKGIGSDWDFGVYFHKKDANRDLRRLKQNLQDRAFPYRIDVVNLGQAPSWFLEGVRKDRFLLEGEWPKSLGEKVA
ncbi:MAG: nucleotidyltransferase domain-containing protein [Deltaproteobacteria bacterium]|nr:nucleotidyltransferase domain-containing protein [Deltaproteobacteria bacterium]